MIDSPMKSRTQASDKHAKSNLSTQLQQQWQSGGALSTALIPLAMLNGAIQKLRKRLYQNGFKSTYKAPCPVIVVGNIYVGGTGKTPVVAAICEALKNKGFTPGIISRGYGVKIGKAARVAAGASAKAELIGDEPALLAQYAPIAVHPKRALAIKALLRQYPETDVIIADDGLQHLALQRDVEIVVQDERGIGNARLLPAGPLRESATKLAEVDFILTNRNHRHFHKTLSPNDSKPYHVDMRIIPSTFVNLQSYEEVAPSLWQAQHRQRSIAAVAGIGNPQRFFNSLKELHISPQKLLPFPDHYAYSAADFVHLHEDIILMTEKDAIKCRDFADERFWFLKVRAEFSDSNFFERIEQLIK